MNTLNFIKIGPAQMFKVIKRSIFLTLGLSLVINSNAQTLSPAMLEQFKSLPLSEQQALAKQYGVDLGSIKSSSKSSPVGTVSQELPQAEKSNELQVEEKNAVLSKAVKENSSVAETIKAVKNPLVRFGVDLFDREVSTFAPTDNAMVPADYRLGVGDELIIQLFGKESDLLTLQVGRDGIINFPKLGPISVAGLSFDEAQRLINARVDKQLIGVESMVSMGRLRAMNIFMAGEVSVPGAYSVSALTTITQALFQAGGVTDIGSLRNIQVKRGGELVSSFDVYDLLLKGDISGDIRLQSGDVVFVPPYEALVTLTGELKRPAVYEVKKGQTLGEMVAMAGGYKSSAFAGELVLIKKRNPGELPVAVNIKAENSDQLAIEMSNGDIVRVLPLGDNVENLITLEGALARPGVYGWKEGIRVSDLIGDMRRDLLPDADLGYSLILREKNQKLDIDVLEFSLVEALSNKGSPKDPILQARDKVLVFKWEGVTQLNEELAGSDLSTADNTRAALLKPVIKKLEAQSDASNPASVATLVGPVRSSGTYPIQEGYRLSDLFAAAGGVLEQADRSYGLIVRIKNSNLDIETLQFSLSDVLAKQGTHSDLVLKPRDRVLVFEWDGLYEDSVSGIDENEPREFSREALLAPVIAKLISQARSDQPANVVSIGGAVKVPGQYPLGVNYTLQDLVDAAGGLDDSAFQENFEVRRIVQNANSENEVQVLEINNARSFALQSRDFVNVRQMIDWNPDAEVEVAGEVKYPGKYLLRRGETLSDIVVRAGGFTNEGNPQGAIFTRKSVAELEATQARLFGQQLQREVAASLMTNENSTVDYTAVSSIIADLNQFAGLGRLVVNLDKALNGDEASDLLLEDGDRLVIPKKSNTITVVGEVRRQGSHTFERGFNIDDYLGLAAGTSSRADDKNIYVVRANGSVEQADVSWTKFTPRSVRLQPGDTIVVPINTDYKDFIPFWRDITQIIYQGTVAIAAVGIL
ncbi:Polysialic acid transport protein KpsD precursor [Marinobacterium sp. xm-a-152]|nr:Polysialic acid transport protein KpsD precursor [Marinobacterium sp. xm-a-152]